MGDNNVVWVELVGVKEERRSFERKRAKIMSHGAMCMLLLRHAVDRGRQGIFRKLARNGY